MNKKLYNLMDWARIEEVVYGECDSTLTLSAGPEHLGSTLTLSAGPEHPGVHPGVDTHPERWARSPGGPHSP